MIHEAGVLLDGVQRCTRCGYVLTDYRNTMVPDGSPPLRGFPVGVGIAVYTGNPRHSIVVSQPPDCTRPEDDDE